MHFHERYFWVHFHPSLLFWVQLTEPSFCFGNGLMGQQVIIPRLQRSWKGVILVSPCRSVCLSVCGQNRARSISSTIIGGSFHICTSYQATSEGVSPVKFVTKFKHLKFWRILQICNFFWGGVSSEHAGVLVVIVVRTSEEYSSLCQLR